MHVLFIGGTGLISTAIARQLLEAGHQVTLFNRGRSENRLPPGAEVLHGDRKDYRAFEATFADKTYDVAVDMVAFHPDDSASAVRALAGRVGQFIHCSTVCVYSGPVTQIPTTETEPYHSIGQYGKNKILCEQLLMREWETRRFPVTIMRPSHSYGEGGAIIRSFGPSDTFVDRLRKGKPLIVQGDGNSLWASCHVDDVARGFIGTMGNPQCLGQAYNITGDEWMTWNTYHEQVAEVVGGSFEPVHIPTDVLREVAPQSAGGTYEIFAWPSVFDNSKIKRDTSYTGQTISWREGVRRTVDWLESKDKLADSDQDDYE
ncbi:MAG: SDR family oxidoreductase, partial [Armatimonadota bacterium]|nr:SDR family oxidoreductase [Armatimonadota bacterium]